ncbi:hypothetical protein [Hyunsoonleella ulvae]|uniref:hypothetical protein n=1 Tax=Hyunsoonleella ulvae TaxID=2799948 RepID=UPI001939339E|nr:hypothetical protein [Hyunsoonleella ulvae]
MKKDIFIGILIGFISNGIGFIIASFIIGKLKGYDLISAIQTSFSEGSVGQIISLGAILNLIAFFIFIKKRQDYRARGVLIITVFIAVFTFVIKLF